MSGTCFRLADQFFHQIRLFLILAYVVTAIFLLWFILIYIGVLPFNKGQYCCFSVGKVTIPPPPSHRHGSVLMILVWIRSLYPHPLPFDRGQYF